MADFYDITPVAKPRMTQRDKWAKRPAVSKYYLFKDLCRLHSVALPDTHHVTFLVPMPQSWSKKKKAEMYLQPHRQRPDGDNFIKALWDAVLPEDSHIYDFRVTKKWAYQGGIKIEPLINPYRPSQPFITEKTDYGEQDRATG